MYQDAHLHLQRGEDFEKLQLPTGAGRFFINTASYSDFETLKDAALSDRVFPFYGIHPWFADGCKLSYSTLSDTISGLNATGVGESGLDFSGKYKKSREVQIRVFEYQVKIAAELGLPLSVHCVGACEQLFKSFDRCGPPARPFILHSFYGSAEILQRLLKLGAYISLSELSLKNPEKSFQVISQIPPGRMLIESDLAAGAPGVTATGYLERLENTYDTAASILKMDNGEFEQRIWENGTVFTN